MRDIELKRLNDVFGQELGRTPNGQPLFKWAKTCDLFYLLEDTVDTQTEAGLYVPINGYQKISWEQRIGPGWVVASWRDPGSERQWKAMFKNALPYPPNGMYFPIPNSHIPCEPTIEITMEAVVKIRQPLEEGFESILARCKAQGEAEDLKLRSDLSDEIDSDWPAFDGAPMSKPYPKDKEIILQ